MIKILKNLRKVQKQKHLLLIFFTETNLNLVKTTHNQIGLAKHYSWQSHIFVLKYLNFKQRFLIPKFGLF